jgi:transcriptional regulator with XRE-family HTH domain
MSDVKPVAGRPLTPFAQWLREHRDRLGISMAEAARRAGVSRTAWTYADRGYGKRGPATPCGHNRDVVIKLAEAVGGDVDEALRLTGYASLRQDATAKSASGKPQRRPAEDGGSTLLNLIELMKDLTAVPADQLGETVMFLRWASSLNPQQRRHLIGFAESLTGVGDGAGERSELGINTLHSG